MDQRYLTVGEKRRRIAEWQAARRKRIPKGEQAGKGYPDRAVFELTDRLNRLKGVCTAQSCAGHPRLQGQRHWRAPGNLWLRLSEEMFGAAVESAQALAQHPHVEQVGVLWGRERAGHVFEILFHGLDVGEAELVEASDVIVGFFMACVESA